MRYLTVFLLSCLSYFTALAQVPQSGLYKLNTQRNNYFGASHYAEQFRPIDDFMSMQIIPHREVTAYGLTYAIVAVNKTHTTAKIAFLKDTVTEKGKQIFAATTKNPPADYSYTKGPWFSQLFAIKDGKLTPSDDFDNYFPGRIDLTGKWFFGQNDYDLFGIYKDPKIEDKTYRDTISGNYRSGKNYIFEQSFFNYMGKSTTPYVDLLFNENKPKIPLYAQPNSKALIKNYFEKGEYIAVSNAASEEWYAVDKIEVCKDNHKYYSTDYGMIAGTTYPNTISGWIKLEDLVSSPWVKQKQQTKQFSFDISATTPSPEESAYSSDGGTVDAIRIINKKTGKHQLILNVGAVLRSNQNEVIQVQDCNFDGYPDISLLMQTGGAGPNDTHNFYLYNPQTGDFEYNDELSQFPQIHIDTKNKLISTGWRNGAANHGGETYTYINKQLVKTADWNQAASAGYFVQESKGELIDGQWIEQENRGIDLLTSAAVYNSPDELNKPVETVSKGDYAYITAEKPLFFFAEITTATNHKVKGWIKKETVFPDNWLGYTAQTPLYKFESVKDANSQPVALRVTRLSDQKVIQLITTLNDADTTNNILYVDDYNFDGFPDFSLRASSKDDTENNNLYENYYFYDQTESIFKLDTLLSSLPNVNFDPVAKTISSIETKKTGTTLTSYQKIFKIVNGKYTLFEEKQNPEPTNKK
ncbi:XAC2610-related protein [Pedobacter cryoconitis]|uniref:VCBS repeat protein n=1 Tax=Pedobacter cryoconitis TaxID=188932 RepID=A0A7X0MIA3_9SPHI|nr:hypothetical protein [Pedobacter cryoconitis]MBB6498320.1 hypothetical protein [Pedobacter cryoconitis]